MVLYKFYLTSVIHVLLATSSLFWTRRVRAVYLTTNPTRRTARSSVVIRSTINLDKHTRKIFKTQYHRFQQQCASSNKHILNNNKNFLYQYIQSRDLKVSLHIPRVDHFLNWLGECEVNCYKSMSKREKHVLFRMESNHYLVISLLGALEESLMTH